MGLGAFYWKTKEKWDAHRYKMRCFYGDVRIWLAGVAIKTTVMEDKSVRCIVVCAHPDDETIFFSSVLKEKKPFVVCMSHSGDRVRKKEFNDALSRWSVEGIILNVPDIRGLKGNLRGAVIRNLKRLKKKWPQLCEVYTHSGQGESGHPHHYAVYEGVKKVFSNVRIITTASQVPMNGEGLLSENAKAEKYDIICSCYPSQIKMLERWCPWWKDYLSTEFFEE